MFSVRRPGNTALEPQEVSGGVLAFAQVQVISEQVPTLRKVPGPWQGEALAPTALKYSDEQTLAGLSAILQAMDRFHLHLEDFHDWGILACPRFIGRGGLAPAIEKFKTGGAPVIQPNVIPHRCLHALSGTLSQVLKMHGPNLGVGGGPLQDRELLQAAASFLISDQAPGYWLIFSGHDPEYVPERPGVNASPWTCHALAVAVSATPNHSAWQLRIGASPPVSRIPALIEAPELLLHQLGEFLNLMTSGQRNTSLTWQVPLGPRLTLAHVATDAAKETILAFPQSTYRVAV